MWQLWTSDDMEFFVDKYATPGDAASVLGAMDRCAETSWMMNMGPAKGDLIEAAVRRKRPRPVLEIGTFLGYMSIRLARSMPRDATLTTIEVDRATYDASLRIRAKARSTRRCAAGPTPPSGNAWNVDSARTRAVVVRRRTKS
ncbi:O-methyltransferase [Aureococcus anophagefferens]|nr:O-methyltransferase [Aureococcus anophagefferens]